MKKVLILLPNSNDLAESSKLDKKQYEVHILHASEHVASKSMGTFDYERFLAKPEFLILYVDRAVAYVKEHGITAIMYGHDMSSVVSSVVCEKTGLRGPTLESTFCCLHKYYSRTTDRSDIWYDYIHLDQPTETWKDKVRYPCFLKAPFLTASKGHSCIDNETAMVDALGTLKKLIAPYFKGYSNFFKKYLDLKKYPFAIENIVVAEELVQVGSQYCSEGWVDEMGKFTFFCANDEFLSQRHREVLLAMLFPPFTLEKLKMEKLIAITEETGQRFGLRNTFFDIEIWEHEGRFTLVEVNSRVASQYSSAYKKMWGVSAYEAAVNLACGQMEILRQLTPPQAIHKDGQPISGVFVFPTRGEGIGSDIIDYQYARYGSIKDGAYTNDGPGFALFLDENSVVKQVSSTGVNMCYFMITDTNATQLIQRARNMMAKAILQAEDLDLVQLKL